MKLKFEIGWFEGYSPAALCVTLLQWYKFSSDAGWLLTLFSIQTLKAVFQVYLEYEPLGEYR